MIILVVVVMMMMVMVAMVVMVVMVYHHAENIRSTILVFPCIYLGKLHSNPADRLLSLVCRSINGGTKRSRDLPKAAQRA